jgi:hypothetical protein
MLIGIVIIMLVIIYIMSQNNKVQMLFDNLKSIDHELELKLPRYISEGGQVDVFTLQEIRSMIKKDYVHMKKIDDFRIYKESMYKIKLILKSGLAVQALEIITSDSKIMLKEIALKRSDIELLNN